MTIPEIIETIRTTATVLEVGKYRGLHQPLIDGLRKAACDLHELEQKLNRK